jgi:Domain of unknown function (DUF1942)
MNIISAAMSAVAAVATAAGIGIAASPTASGDSNPVIQKFGTEETLVNSGVVQGWTVGDLQPSTDAINVSIRGKLWEATATDKAIQGQAMPLPFRFSARTPSGQDYGYVLGVPTPPSFSWNYIPQGQSATGKLYFDVTGDNPNGVVYRTGPADLLIWAK